MQLALMPFHLCDNVDWKYGARMTVEHIVHTLEYVDFVGDSASDMKIEIICN